MNPVVNTDVPSDERIIELVTERRHHSVNYHRSYLNRLPGYYDLYRGVYSGRTPQFRNAVHIPFLFSVVQSDVARKTQVSFGAWPIVSFAGYGIDDSANAKRNETLVSAQMKDCRSFQKAVDLFLTADLYGVGIARYGWKKTAQQYRWRQLENIAPGLDVEVWREDDGFSFNGPDWEVIDPLDFWPQPGKKDIADMSWLIHRYYVDLDDLKRMAKQGLFDKSAIAKLEDRPLSGQAEAELQGRLSIYRNFEEYNARRTEPFAKPVEIWEYWGTVPDEFAKDGFTERCIAIANGRVVAKNWPNPILNGKKPFVSHAPMADPHYFHGVGKIEVGAKMQMAANRMTNQKLDALDQFIDPMWIASDNANLNVQNLATKPGRIFQVSGPADDSNIRPLIPNLNGLQWGDAAVGQMWSFIQQGTGITEALQGLTSGNRSTAREFLGRQENVMTRLMLESRIAEEGFVEPLADAFRVLNRQYLPLPHLIQMLGDRATINPVTGLPLPQEPTWISHEDVSPDYRARAVGATQMIGKAIRQQNVMQLLQVMNANPVLMQLVNWSNFSRQMFQLFDFDNVSELLNLSQLPMVNQMANDNGMSPETLAGGLESLDPAILGQLIPQQAA